MKEITIIEDIKKWAEEQREKSVTWKGLDETLSEEMNRIAEQHGINSHNQVLSDLLEYLKTKYPLQ